MSSSVTGPYNIGDLPRVSGRFTDYDGALADPTAITVTLVKPDGTVTPFDETDLDNPSIGIWRFLLPAPIDQEGIWSVRFQGTEGIIASDEVSWLVKCARVA